MANAFMAGVEALNTPPPPDHRELWKHLCGTYFSLRLALALTALLLPVSLWAWGRIYHGLDLQPSMSGYFWAAATQHCASFPMRTLFVGGLIAISLALYAYKGLTKLEDLLLNAAGFFGAVVAFFPERLPNPAKVTAIPQNDLDLYASCPAVQDWAIHQQWRYPVHFLAAGLMFTCLFFVVLKCSGKSLAFLPPDAAVRPETFRIFYRGIAWAMPIVAGGFVALDHFAGDGTVPYVFLLEAFEIWLFSAYWWLKTYELRLSGIEKDPDRALANYRRHGAA